MGRLVTLRSVEHLRAAMRLAGVGTNRQLHETTGVSLGVVGMLLAGRKRHVRRETAEALADGLGQDAAALFVERAAARKPPPAAGRSSPRRPPAAGGPTPTAGAAP